MDTENDIGVSREVAISAGIRIMNATDLGKCLRARRKKLGYTQEQVAQFLGFSPRLIGEMERGKASVGFDRMMRYATNLGIDFVAFER